MEHLIRDAHMSDATDIAKLSYLATRAIQVRIPLFIVPPGAWRHDKRQYMNSPLGSGPSGAFLETKLFGVRPFFV